MGHAGTGLFQGRLWRGWWENQCCKFGVLVVLVVELHQAAPCSLSIDLPLDFSGMALKKSEQCGSAGVSVLI